MGGVCPDPASATDPHTMAEQPSDFDQPVNRARLERLAAERGDAQEPPPALPADGAP